MTKHEITHCTFNTLNRREAISLNPFVDELAQLMKRHGLRDLQGGSITLVDGKVHIRHAKLDFSLADN